MPVPVHNLGLNQSVSVQYECRLHSYNIVPNWGGEDTNDDVSRLSGRLGNVAESQIFRTVEDEPFHSTVVWRRSEGAFDAFCGDLLIQ